MGMPQSPSLPPSSSSSEEKGGEGAGKGGGAVGVSGSGDGEEEEEMAMKKPKNNPAGKATRAKAKVCFWCMRVHKTIIDVLVYMRLLAFAVCLIIHNDYFS